MAAVAAQYYSGFAFVDVAAFRRSKSMSKQDLVDISQLMAKIFLFPFLKNKLPPYWKSTFGFDFDHLPEIAHYSASGYRI